MSLGLRCLALAIRGYRRWVSGRGPLRRVACSFVDTESCSAYGLRVAETAPSLMVALRRIHARLRRCRDTSIYRLEIDGRELLLWGCAHDRPEALDAALAQADELPASRRAVLAASRRVAAYRGRWDLVAELGSQLDELGDPTTPHPRLLARRGERVIELMKRRLIARLAGLGAFVALIAVGLARTPTLALALALALGPCLLGLLRLRHYLDTRRRFEQLMAARAFSTANRAELDGPPMAAGPASGGGRAGDG